jgi:hypothetical protein
MKKVILMMVMLAMVSIIGCGPSKEDNDKKAEKNKEDLWQLSKIDIHSQSGNAKFYLADNAKFPHKKNDGTNWNVDHGYFYSIGVDNFTGTEQDYDDMLTICLNQLKGIGAEDDATICFFNGKENAPSLKDNYFEGSNYFIFDKSKDKYFIAGFEGWSKEEYTLTKYPHDSVSKSVYIKHLLKF